MFCDGCSVPGGSRRHPWETVPSAFGPSFVFMDDNASPYTVVVVDDYLKSAGFARMQCPDLLYDVNVLKFFVVLSQMLYVNVSHS